LKRGVSNARKKAKGRHRGGDSYSKKKIIAAELGQTKLNKEEESGNRSSGPQKKKEKTYIKKPSHTAWGGKPSMGANALREKKRQGGS